MIKEYIGVFEEMLASGCCEKTQYEDALALCDELIFSFLENNDFNGYEGIQLFRVSTEERLSIAKNKLEKCKNNPNLALKEIVKEKMLNLERFIEKYRIGFIKEAKLQESGYISVEIPCLITKRGYDTNPHSADVLFEMQLAFLKEQGFILEKDKMGIYLVNNDVNITKIREILQNKKCKHIEIYTLDNRIRSISFVVNILDVENFNEETFEFKLPKTNILNEDEKTLLLKYVKEIIFAEEFIKCAENKCKDTCCSLIESYYSQICDIFDFNGNVKKQHEKRFSKEREQNIEIAKIEEQVAVFYNNVDIKENLSALKIKIENFTSEKLCFSVGDFYFDKYGILNMSLRYITNPLFLMVENCMSEEDLKEIYSVTIGDRENEDIYIRDTYENKEKIEQIIKQFIPNVVVRDFSVSKRNGYYIITNLTIFVDEVFGLIEK